jgi:hypothetical protein
MRAQGDAPAMKMISGSVARTPPSSGLATFTEWLRCLQFRHLSWRFSVER